jgi:hypothetical protein
MHALTKRTPPPEFSREELLGLERYDHMVKAIVKCQQEKYARAAKNYESELRALDIRLRASIGAGQLIAEGQKNGKSSSRSPRLIPDSSKPKTKPKTLKQLGISYPGRKAGRTSVGAHRQNWGTSSPCRMTSTAGAREFPR